MVPFAGFLLPVQYGTGVIAEHMAVKDGLRPVRRVPIWERSCVREKALSTI